MTGDDERIPLGVGSEAVRGSSPLVTSCHLSSPILSLLLLFVFSLLVFGPGLTQKGATTSFDERLYFLVAKEMLARHEFLIAPSTREVLPGHSYDETLTHLQPSLDLPAFYKEPLLYWCFGVAFSVFGSTIPVARGVIALFSAGTILVTYLLGKTLFDEKTGVLASLLLLSSLGFFQLGREMMLDVPLLFFVLFGIYLSLVGVSKSPGSNLVLGMCSFGVSSLLKGPLGPLLGLAILAGYFLFVQKPLTIQRRSWLLGFIFMAALFFAYPLALAAKGFGRLWFQHFVVTEILGKFVSEKKPPWVILTSLLSYEFPWTLLFLASLLNARESFGNRRLQFVAWGFVVPILLFMLPARKIDRYVLPALPFTSLFISFVIGQGETFFLKGGRAVTAILLLAVGLAGMIVLTLIRVPGGAWVGLFLMLFATAAFLSLLRAKYSQAAIAVAFCFALTPMIFSLPSRPYQNEAKAMLTRYPSFATDSVVDEVFTLTGLNSIEVHTPQEMESAVRNGFLITCTHELQDVPESVLKSTHEIFHWTRWNPAFRPSAVWKSIKLRDPSPILESVIVFSNKAR